MEKKIMSWEEFSKLNTMDKIKTQRMIISGNHPLYSAIDNKIPQDQRKRFED